MYACREERDVVLEAISRHSLHTSLVRKRTLRVEITIYPRRPARLITELGRSWRLEGGRDIGVSAVRSREFCQNARHRAYGCEQTLTRIVGIGGGDQLVLDA